MLELERQLARKLEQLRIRIDVPDENTAIFRGVPTNASFYSKAKTNLLLTRPQERLPFLACVDEDLEYKGTDKNLTRIFVGAERRNGWRVLFVEPDIYVDFQTALENSLTALGSDGTAPEIRFAGNRDKRKGGRLIVSFGDNLSKRVYAGEAETTVGRAEAIDTITACLTQWQLRFSLITGPPGVGKTNLLWAIARRLGQCRSDLQVVRLDLAVFLAGTLFEAERARLLLSLFEEAIEMPKIILALEHLDLILTDVPRGDVLLGQWLDCGLRLLGTAAPMHLAAFEQSSQARRFQTVEVVEPTAHETFEVLLSLKDALEKHHNVRIDDSLLHAAVKRAQSLAGQYPAKAIALLDSAMARAALAQATELGLHDLYLAAGVYPESKDQS